MSILSIPVDEIISLILSGVKLFRSCNCFISIDVKSILSNPDIVKNSESREESILEITLLIFFKSIDPFFFPKPSNLSNNALICPCFFVKFHVHMKEKINIFFVSDSTYK